MKNLFFLFLGFILIGNVKADEILAQTKFSTRNNNKEFSVQYLSSRNLCIVHFGLLWANFNTAIHSNGFKLSETKGVEFITPKLPEGCILADSSTTNLPIMGFLNGIDAGSNVLRFVLKGKSCEVFTQALRQNNFEAVFQDVPAMQTGAPVTSSLRLEVLEIP